MKALDQANAGIARIGAAVARLEANPAAATEAQMQTLADGITVAADKLDALSPVPATPPDTATTTGT